MSLADEESAARRTDKLLLEIFVRDALEGTTDPGVAKLVAGHLIAEGDLRMDVDGVPAIRLQGDSFGTATVNELIERVPVSLRKTDASGEVAAESILEKGLAGQTFFNANFRQVLEGARRKWSPDPDVRAKSVDEETDRIAGLQGVEFDEAIRTARARGLGTGR